MENSIIDVARGLDPEWRELIWQAREQGLSVEEIRSFLWQGENQDREVNHGVQEGYVLR